jgi:hypothetical protein
MGRTGRRPKGKTPLKGGIGDVALTPEQAIATRADWLEVNRPTTYDQLRKRMLVKETESRTQIAEAALAAARQHRLAPDEGTRLYGRAFQSLPESSRAQLLDVLGSDAERQLVRESFADYIDAAPQSDATPANTDTSAGRADTAAREALAAVSGDIPGTLQALDRRLGVERVPVVDLDPTLAPESSGKTYVPLSPGETTTTSEGTNWNKKQRDRGWRRVVYAPTEAGGAPQQVLELLASRADEFTTEAPAAPPGRANPNYGKTRMDVRVREPEGSVQTVERLTPAAFEELSEDARRAAAQGREIWEAIQRFEQYNPDFLDTAEGQRLGMRLGDLMDAHPEASPFIDNPTLGTRPNPVDVATPPSGKRALPKSMQLGYIAGGLDLGKKAEGRVDRRRGGRMDVPADAPNRMGWMEVLDQEEKGREVRLPRSDEVGSNKDPERANLEYKGETEPRRALLEGPESTPDLDLADNPLEASDAELAAALGESEYGPVFSESDTAQPVSSAIEGMNPREVAMMGFDPDPTGVELTRGTATGSPSRVKADRDFALREDRSFLERIQEKLFRTAMEMQDAGMVDSGAVREATGTLDTPEGVTTQFLGELIGADAGPRKQARVSGPAPRMSGEMLKLDGLMPAWRAKMAFADGDEVTVRRPTPYEVAGYLLSRFDIGEPSLAAQLEPAVRRSMEYYEGIAPNPNSKAARLAGATLAPSASYARDLEKVVMSRRQPGDTRPVFSAEAQAALKNPGPSQQQFTPVTQAPAEPTAATPSAVSQQPSGGGLFAGMLDAAKSKGAKNITGLLALAGAGAGASQGQAGELPPVEYLAMAPRGSKSAAAAASRARKAAGSKGTTPPAGNATAVPVPQSLPPVTTPGAQAATPQPLQTPPGGPAPPSNVGALFQGVQPSQPAPAPQQAVANAAPQQAAVAATTATPATTPPGRNAAQAVGDYFGRDPLVRAGKAVAGTVGPFLPTTIATAAAAPRIYQLLKWYAGQFSDDAQAQPAATTAPAAGEESLESIFKDYNPEATAAPQPVSPMPMPRQSTNNITQLQSMLSGMPTQRYMTDIDMPGMNVRREQIPALR